MENRCFLTIALSPSKNSVKDKRMVQPPCCMVIPLLPERRGCVLERGVCNLFQGGQNRNPSLHLLCTTLGKSHHLVTCKMGIVLLPQIPTKTALRLLGGKTLCSLSDAVCLLCKGY